MTEMTFLLIINDGLNMRAFHPSVLDDHDRKLVEKIARRLVERADDLFGSSKTEDLIKRIDDILFAPTESDWFLTKVKMARTSGMVEGDQ